MISADELYARLKGLQEPKGYYLNHDHNAVWALLDGLIKNMQRYGYMSCPCRLASGKYDDDKDIICPCRYRDADVAEYGSCYCGLYVSPDWNEGRIEHVYIPERRPVAL